MHTVITDAVFAAFLKCPTKGVLGNSGPPTTFNEFFDWQLEVEHRYKARCLEGWKANFAVTDVLSSPSHPEELKSGRYAAIAGCAVEGNGLRSDIDALERVSVGSRRRHYIPIRMISKEKLTRDDKSLLAFDALTLMAVFGTAPTFGKIVHGNDRRVVRVKLPSLVKTARSIVAQIAKQYASNELPSPILNKHCSECQFRARCRTIAEERDDLSLLSTMNSAERERLRNKGIFSIHQLSYTFRPRRKPKDLPPIQTNIRTLSRRSRSAKRKFTCSDHRAWKHSPQGSSWITSITSKQQRRNTIKRHMNKFWGGCHGAS